MEKLFRLKPEVAPLFPSCQLEVSTMEVWNKRIIHDNLLEPCKYATVKYGVKYTENSTRLRESDGKESNFYFTLRIEGYLDLKDHQINDLITGFEDFANKYLQSNGVAEFIWKPATVTNINLKINSKHGITKVR